MASEENTCSFFLGDECPSVSALLDTYPANVSFLPIEEARELFGNLRDLGPSVAVAGKTCPEGRNALFYAVQRDSGLEACELAAFLLGCELVTPQAHDAYGQTALFYAAREGNLECLKLLVDQYGLDVSHEDDARQTPLFYAARDGQTEVVEYLCSKGADINHIDANGDTPIFYAARDGREETIKLMLELGADSAYKNRNGFHPGTIARERKHASLARLLEAHRKKVISRAAPNGRRQASASTPPIGDSLESDAEPERVRPRGKSSKAKSAVGTPRGGVRAKRKAGTDENDKATTPDNDADEISRRKRTAGEVADDQASPSRLARVDSAEKKEQRALYCLQYKTLDGLWAYICPFKLEEFEVLYPEIAKVWTSAAACAAAGLENDLHRSEWHRLARELMRHLMEEVEDSRIFREPVDPVKWKIPDYFEIIKNPMDFGTILIRLEVGLEYRCIADFMKDLDQVFVNCLLYNRPDSTVGKIGKSVQAKALEYSEKIGLERLRQLEERQRQEAMDTIRQTVQPATTADEPRDDVLEATVLPVPCTVSAVDKKEEDEEEDGDPFQTSPSQFSTQTSLTNVDELAINSSPSRSSPDSIIIGPEELLPVEPPKQPYFA